MIVDPRSKHLLSQVKVTKGYFEALKQNQSKSVRGDLVGYTGFSALSTRYVPPEILRPPKNILVSTPLYTKFAYDITWDINPDLRVLGYSIYRAFRDTGEYIRLNNYIISTNQYRDQTRDVHITYEDLKAQLPLLKNDSQDYVCHTSHFPIVDPNSMAKATDSFDSVQLYINGTQVPLKRVLGRSGEIVLRSTKYFDPKTETLITPTIPTASDDFRASYWYNENLIQPAFGQRAFYKITSIAYDEATGELIETDPAYLESNAISGEPVDWIWTEAIRRNAWIISMAGERFLVFLRKIAGEVCDCVYEDYGSNQPSALCSLCYGTGFIGGYEEPIPIVAVVPAAKKEILIQEDGRKVEHINEFWCTNRPVLNQGDLLLRFDGSIHVIGGVRHVSVKGNIYLQQSFTVQELERTMPQYKLLDKTSIDSYRNLQYMSGANPPRTSSAEFNLIANKIDPVTISDFKGRSVRYASLTY